MELTLDVLRCPEAAVPESRRSSGGDLAIGRGLEAEWQLQDPDRVLSKRHCTLEYRGGFWQVRDLSTNGTFLNHAPEPIGRDLVASLKDGDRLRLGGYEIEVRIAGGTQAGSVRTGNAPTGIAQGGAGGWATPLAVDQAGRGSYAPDPFSDPFAPVPVAAPMAGFGGASGGFGGSVLPNNFDPFGDEPPMPDHQAAASDAFVPPRVTRGAALPDDWGLDFDIMAPAAAGPTAPAPAPAAPVLAVPPARLPEAWPEPRGAVPPATGAPAVALSIPHLAAPPAGVPVDAWDDDFAVASAAKDIAAKPAPAAAPPLAPFDDPPDGSGQMDPFAEEGLPNLAVPDLAVPGIVRPLVVAPLQQAAPQRPPPPSALRMAPHMTSAPVALGASPLAAPAAADAVAILLRAAGLAPRVLGEADPVAVLEAAGASLRAAIGGIRALLIARADVKREFRIEQTMLRAAGNNPLKFAATDEAAMVAMLVGKAGPWAVAETARDLTAHQVATLAATQAAARALLQRLAPAGLEGAEKGGGFLGSREKRLWEAYKALHTQVTDQFEDDFDSAFGKEFARAYEQASGKEPPA